MGFSRKTCSVPHMAACILFQIDFNSCCCASVSNRSQKMSKCGKSKKVTHELLGKCVTDVFTTFWHLLQPITEQAQAKWNLSVLLYNKETKKCYWYHTILKQIISDNQSKCENNLNYIIKLDSCMVITVHGSLLWHIFQSYLKCLFHKYSKRISSFYFRQHFNAPLDISKCNYLVVLSNGSSAVFFGLLFWFSCDAGPSWPAVLGLLLSVWTWTLVVKKVRQNCYAINGD